MKKWPGKQSLGNDIVGAVPVKARGRGVAKLAGTTERRLWCYKSTRGEEAPGKAWGRWLCHSVVGSRKKVKNG